jgi:protein-tyrosine phosphatase
MQLDYAKGCVNFRDVGEFVNLIAERPLLPEGKLYRGGKLDFVTDAASIGAPCTIVNLRKSQDKHSFGACAYDFPISNDYEKYETHNREVGKWLNRVLEVFARPDLAFPVFVHCTSGKDRTGVVVAALLKILQIPDDIIIEEYLLSEGEVKAEWIQTALAGIGTPESYFKRLNLDQIRQHFTVP